MARTAPAITTPCEPSLHDRGEPPLNLRRLLGLGEAASDSLLFEELASVFSGEAECIADLLQSFPSPAHFHRNRNPWIYPLGHRPRASTLWREWLGGILHEKRRHILGK